MLRNDQNPRIITIMDQECDPIIIIITTTIIIIITITIRNATPSDSGEYECQVSSEPKLSKSVNLLVQGDDDDDDDDDDCDDDDDFKIISTLKYQCRCSGLREARASWLQRAATSVSDAGLTIAMSCRVLSYKRWSSVGC